MLQLRRNSAFWHLGWNHSLSGVCESDSPKFCFLFVSTVTVHTKIKCNMTDSRIRLSSLPLLHVEELFKPSWEVVVACVSQRATLTVPSEELSADLVLTARLCCISGETYCHANPKMMFVFGLNQSTSPESS